MLRYAYITCLVLIHFYEGWPLLLLAPGAIKRSYNTGDRDKYQDPEGHQQCNQYIDYVTGWTVRGSNPDWDKIFYVLKAHPDRPWDPPSLLYNGYRGSFPGVKRPGRGVDHTPQSSVEVRHK